MLITLLYITLLFLGDFLWCRKNSNNRRKKISHQESKCLQRYYTSHKSDYYSQSLSVCRENLGCYNCLLHCF